MSIRPLHDRVLVERNAEETRSAGGIVIPDSIAEKPASGKIVGVGKGKLLDSGETRPLDVKIGDEVLFGKYAGTEVKDGDKTYIVMREDDIMGVVEA